MNIGILALQGDISEHAEIMRRACEELEITPKIIPVKNKDHLQDIDRIILPGGESTTIGKLLVINKMFDELKEKISEGLPVLATCAGLILLAKKGNGDMEKTKQPLMRLMNINVKRNAFGRQRESFEAEIEFLPKKTKITGVFIRAPVILEVGKGVEVVAKYEDLIVGAREKNMLAVAFHPELTDDTTIHKYFLGM
ncbi:MAG: pyridoxal 5'-phosphate synthase glutaminase subunit PdxT [Candidatus Hydrothermarchaeota archaeon]